MDQQSNTVPPTVFTWGESEIHEKTCNSRFTGQDSNPAPPEYKLILPNTTKRKAMLPMLRSPRV